MTHGHQYSTRFDTSLLYLVHTEDTATNGNNSASVRIWELIFRKISGKFMIVR
jgi:hypothetical protein